MVLIEKLWLFVKAAALVTLILFLLVVSISILLALVEILFDRKE